MCRLMNLAVSVFLLFAPGAYGAVLVVDPGGGGTHLEISAAVTAAVDGDTVLIKTGAYNPFLVSGKSLTLVADQGASVIVRAFFSAGVPTIEGVPSGGLVVLRGVAFVWSPLDFPLFGLPSLHLRNNDGAVRLEDCSVTGATGRCDVAASLDVSGSPALRIEACDSVALIRCEIRGGDGGDGGPFAPCCSGGGVGLTASASQIAAYETTIAGGVGGVGCPSGSDEVVSSGALLTNLGSGRTFCANSPLRPGETAGLVFVGIPGEAVVLLVGVSPIHVPKPDFAGVFLVDPALVVALSTIPASGTLTLLVTANGVLPAGVSALTLSLQPGFIGFGGSVVASPSIVTLLGPGI